MEQLKLKIQTQTQTVITKTWQATKRMLESTPHNGDKVLLLDEQGTILGRPMLPHESALDAIYQSLQEEVTYVLWQNGNSQPTLYIPATN